MPKLEVVNNKRFSHLDVEQELKALWVRLVDDTNSEVLSKNEGATN
jgi:hypothetical protein